jgi:glyoxylase-like metal-dependent hydrolase (beta-lactamase superfamily II)
MNSRIKTPLLALVVCVLAWSSATVAAEQKPLNVEVFMSSEEHMGLGVASAIIYGEKDAVLVDAQFTLSNAHRLVAEIIETGRSLTTIYITHVHPDHFMGLPVIKQAFPDARVVSLPIIANDVNSSSEFKLEYWGNKVLGHNGAKTKVAVEALSEPVIMLEGRRLEILGPFHADAPNSSVVWIPSIRTLVASDTIYDHAHAWLSATKSPAMMDEWLSVLDRLDALKPEVVVPGHAPSNKYLSPSSIEFTRRYIKTFADKMKAAPDGAALRAEMSRIYPDAAMPFCLEYSSKILKDHWVWEGQWPASLRDMPVTY